MTSDPQPGQLWATPKGRTVEILARDVACGVDVDGYYHEIDVVAYKFLGGSTIHLRAASSLTGWEKVEFE